MATITTGAIGNRWREWLEIARAFLKIGAVSYGGPAIMGIMQAEIQEKRRWVSKDQFVEGLAIVNMLPGPIAAQLAMFLGYAKAGTSGAMLAGICFIIPAFVILLGLTVAYSTYGSLPMMRHIFYGIAPVVIGIFATAVYRLGKASIKERSQALIAIAAGVVVLAGPVGLVTILLACGCIGLALFHSRRNGIAALAVVFALAAAAHLVHLASLTPVAGASPTAASTASAPGMLELALFFAKVGAFTFGGGLSVLAFMQEQVVAQHAWLSAQQFVDGLALGQLTPGPVLMLAAFVGYALDGLKGAVISAVAIFLPAFVLMLAILPTLRRLKDVKWLKAFMRGVAPAVIGMLAVSLAQLALHAASDVLTVVVFLATVAIVLLRNVSPVPLMLTGAFIGIAARGDLLGHFAKLTG